MQRLILLRHGKAEAESESGADIDRRLAPQGEAEVAAMAARLAARGAVPDLALVSSAARTRDTWVAAEPAFPGTQVVFDADLYNAESKFIRRLADLAGVTANTVMVVGHNPGIHELAVRLMQEGSAAAGDIDKARRQFPPGAAAVFLIDANDRPVFDGLYLPERGA